MKAILLELFAWCLIVWCFVSSFLIVGAFAGWFDRWIKK